LAVLLISNRPTYPNKKAFSPYPFTSIESDAFRFEIPEYPI
jgi:hypothetical protein